MRARLLFLLALAACDQKALSAPAAATTSAPTPSESAAPVMPIPREIAAASATPSASVSASASIEPPACPDEMAKSGNFCVDRWEAHLVAVAADGTETAHPHTERPAEGVKYKAKSASGVYPQGYISRVEADAACRAADKRLCSLNEWTRACKGPKWSLFPYGGKGEPGRCNTAKDHLLSKMFGTNGRAWKYDDFNSPKLNAEPGFLEKTGERERCVSPEGVYDMVGSLHEWISTPVTDDLVERLDQEPYERKKQPWREGNGIFMGGFFSTTKEHGPGCTFITIAHEPRYHDYSTGFRCCADAP